LILIMYLVLWFLIGSLTYSYILYDMKGEIKETDINKIILSGCLGLVIPLSVLIILLIHLIMNFIKILKGED